MTSKITTLEANKKNDPNRSHHVNQLSNNNFEELFGKNSLELNICTTDKKTTTTNITMKKSYYQKKKNQYYNSKFDEENKTETPFNSPVAKPVVVKNQKKLTPDLFNLNNKNTIQDESFKSIELSLKNEAATMLNIFVVYYQANYSKTFHLADLSEMPKFMKFYSDYIKEHTNEKSKIFKEFSNEKETGLKSKYYTLEICDTKKKYYSNTLMSLFTAILEKKAKSWKIKIINNK